MLSVRMRFVLLMVCVGVADITAASIKKSISESTVKRETLTKPPTTDTTTTPTSSIPAIVAIEIVNGTDRNASTSKNKKRTIESSLGYGYGGSSLGPEPSKKFMIYKYSQHDIPGTYNQFNGGGGGYNQHSIQNAATNYHIGSTHLQQPSYHAPQFYNPASTLYTTLSHQGQLGGLSNNIPYQNLDHAGMVPVIILRVYTNQLASPDTALHTNLPQSHPYSSLNGINLQSLLQNYVQQYLHTQQAEQHFPVQDYQQLYQGHQQSHQVPEEYHPNLPTFENYPSKHHTRVIFHSNNNGHLPEPKSMFKTAGLSTFKTAGLTLPSYKASQPGYVEVQTPDSQYAYTSGSQHAEQQYMYIYPNQVDQDIYYQGAGQGHQYQVADAQENLSAHVPPTATQENHEAPYNYHAHPREQLGKQKRSKKNSIGVSSTLAPKRRAPRDKAT